MYVIINSGSSSLKFKVFSLALEPLAGGIVERIGLDQSFISYKKINRERKQEFPQGIPNHAEAFKIVRETLREIGIDLTLTRAFGHRVVHGGEEFSAPTRVDAATLERIRKFDAFAPLHNPANEAGIQACMAYFPNVPNVAVFDTAFYSTIPPEAYLYALPWEYYEKHRIRKYGFHGTSHRYVSEEAAKKIGKPYARAKIVSCHLGSGASVTAVKYGKAIDTSMGFTPLEGLTMSTRCGDIDPSIPLYMIRALGLTPDQVDDVLNKKSGLLGVSGYKDLRDVMCAAGYRVPGYALHEEITPEVRKRAKIAIDMFCYDVARYIGQYSAVLGGADAVVFTAGIGERSAFIRSRIMGMVELPGNPKVVVVPTEEELMIARETKKIIGR